MRTTWLYLGAWLALGDVRALIIPPFSARARQHDMRPFSLTTMSMGTTNRRPRTTPPQQQPWWIDVLTSWFKLPPPAGPVADRKASLRKSFEEDRAVIQELRNTNAQLRAELAAIRADMELRGIRVEIAEGDVPAAAPPPPPDICLEEPRHSPPKDTRINPPNRGAYLICLWTAALAMGGVFIPIAIGESALFVERWSNNGCKLFAGSADGVSGFLPWGLRGEWRRRLEHWSGKWLVTKSSSASVVYSGLYISPDESLINAHLEVFPSRR